MIGTRYEEYSASPSSLPFVLHPGLERTAEKRSAEMNWHADPELQLCREGEGYVLLDGNRIPFRAGDLVAVDPNVIHYTGTEGRLVYSSLIIREEFCRRMGFDLSSVRFSPRISGPRPAELFRKLEEAFREKDLWQVPRLNGLMLDLLLALAEDGCLSLREGELREEAGAVKSAVRYIRENGCRKLSLDEIAAAVYTDKFVLCRKFKALTGQTVVEYVNTFRCRGAMETLREGKTVAETAAAWGFESPSFFTKVFKRYTGLLPSEFRKTSGASGGL